MICCILSTSLFLQLLLELLLAIKSCNICILLLHRLFPQHSSFKNFLQISVSLTTCPICPICLCLRYYYMRLLWAIATSSIHVFVEWRERMMCGVSSSSSKLPLSTWTRVTISREGRDGTLTVNDEEPITGRSPGPATELNLQMRLYVGGLPGRPYSSSGVTTGFVGAIQRVCTTSRAQLPQRKSAAGISNSTVVFVPLNNSKVPYTCKKWLWRL